MIAVLNTISRKTHPGSPWSCSSPDCHCSAPLRVSRLGTEALLFGAQLKGLGHVLLLPFKALLLYILMLYINQFALNLPVFLLPLF